MWVDNGNDDTFRVGDNSMSETGFGFRGAQSVGHGLTASFLIEGDLHDDDSTRHYDLSATDAPSDSPAGFEEHHARVGLSGGFGAVFMGRTSSATDGITEIDLGSVSDLMGSDMAAFGGAINLGGDTFEGTFDNMDGFAAGHDDDTVNLVRYDTPVFNGFQGAVAAANGGDVDAAVRYGAKFGATEVKAGIGYAKVNSTGRDNEQWSGSVSARHDSGLNGTFAYGQQDVGPGRDPEFMYAKVGYDIGNWGLAVDYGKTEELNFADRDGKAWGAGAQYDFGNGVSTAVMYRDLDIDIAGTPTRDGKLVVTSLRVKF